MPLVKSHQIDFDLVELSDVRENGNGGKTVYVNYKKGIFKILDVLKIQSILMNHDAGKYWSKSSLIIKPGVINIETISLKYSSDMDEIKERIINHFV